MADGSTSSPISPSGGDRAVFHDMDPKVRIGMRVIAGFTVFMVLLSFIFCLVQGSNKNQTFYLLACNLVISSFVGCVNAYWFRRGDLDVDKVWFVLMVAIVIIFQCLVTDIVVFNLEHEKITPTTVPPQNITMMTIKSEFDY